MKIRTKLFVLNLVFITGIVGSTSILFYEQYVQHNIQRTVQMGIEAKANLYRMNSITKDLLLTSSLRVEYNRFQEQYDLLIEGIERFIQSPLYSKLLLSDSEGDRYANGLNNIISIVNISVAEVDLLIQPILDTYSINLPGLNNAYRHYDDAKISQAANKVNILAGYLGESFESTLNNLAICLQRRAEEVQRRGRIISISMVGFLLVFVLIFDIRIIKTLSTKISKIRRDIKTLGTGDFTHAVLASGNDELSDLATGMNSFKEDFSRVINVIKNISQESFELKEQVNSASNESSAAVNQMVASIGSISRQIESMVIHLNSAEGETQKIAQGIETLSEKIDDQSSAVTQSSSSIEEMSASIENVSKIVQQRQEALELLVNITNRGSEKVELTNKLIKENDEDVREIEKVIEIINNIASQTNLLSMNAAIEAAHAGDSGRGFAVVAEEIRKLSDSTDSNSKRIGKTIMTIAERIRRITEASEENRLSFQRIEKETKQNSSAMFVITTSMKEISFGSTEVMNAMNSLTSITQNIKYNSEQMTESTKAVSEVASTIKEIGDQIQNGMHEIEAASKDISNAMLYVNDLNRRSNESITQLHEHVNHFKTVDAIEGGTESS